jgi:hypothetical protein
VPGVEVSSGELKRRLSDAQRAEVDHHLSQGRSVACYEDQYGRPILVMTYGTRDADVPGYPPAVYGGGSLHSHVPRSSTSKTDAVASHELGAGPPDSPPQVSPSVTEHRMCQSIRGPVPILGTTAGSIQSGCCLVESNKRYPRHRSGNYPKARDGGETICSQEVGRRASELRRRRAA